MFVCMNVCWLWYMGVCSYMCARVCIHVCVFARAHVCARWEGACEHAYLCIRFLMFECAMRQRESVEITESQAYVRAYMRVLVLVLCTCIRNSNTTIRTFDMNDPHFLYPRPTMFPAASDN